MLEDAGGCQAWIQEASVLRAARLGLIKRIPMGTCGRRERNRSGPQGKEPIRVPFKHEGLAKPL